MLPLLGCITNQKNAISDITCHFSKIYFNIILTTTRRNPMLFLLNTACYCRLRMHATCSNYLFYDTTKCYDYVGGSWMNGYGASVERQWLRKTEVLGEKPVPVPICPPQRPHALTWDWTLASPTTNRQPPRISHGMACMLHVPLISSRTKLKHLQLGVSGSQTQHNYKCSQEYFSLFENKGVCLWSYKHGYTWPLTLFFRDEWREMREG